MKKLIEAYNLVIADVLIRGSKSCPKCEYHDFQAMAESLMEIKELLAKKKL